MRDLEMLAGAYAEGGDVEAAIGAVEPDPVDSVGEDLDSFDADDSGEPVEPSPLDDGFVRTFVRASVHVHRFFPYYLGAAAWLAVMLLMSPAGDRSPDNGELAGFRQPATANLTPASEFDAEADAAEISSAPSFADIGATPADTSFALSAPSDSGFDSSSDAGASEEFSSSTFDTSGFESSESSEITIEDEPEPLRITKSGYSSRTGGTPLEQEPPGSGLPVAAVGGEATKRSFIALSGDETVLRLKLVEDPSNVGADAAAVRACPIVSDWEAARGASMDAEPAWTEPCIDGVRGEDGVWTFDLSTFGSLEGADGFALTPGTAPGLSFNLTFDASPVRSS